MKNKHVDPDMEVIGMVNGAAEARQRVKQNRELLHKMASEQKQSRKAAWWRAFRAMAVEAGTFAVAGIAVLFAMAQGLIDPKVAIPAFALCIIWTAIRTDRFVRK